MTPVTFFIAQDDFVMCHASRKSSRSYDDAVVFDLQGRVPASGYASNQYNHDMVQSAFSDELPPCTNSSTVLAAAALS